MRGSTKFTIDRREEDAEILSNILLHFLKSLLNGKDNNVSDLTARILLLFIDNIDA